SCRRTSRCGGSAGSSAHRRSPVRAPRSKFPGRRSVQAWIQPGRIACMMQVALLSSCKWPAGFAGRTAGRSRHHPGEPGAAMTRQEMLERQFGFVYDVVERNVEGMTQEQSLARPAAGGNCANWILGHVVDVQNGLMQVLGEDPVWESDQLVRAGFDPIEGA